MTRSSNLLGPELRNGNSEIIKFNISSDNKKFTKKWRKLSKSQKLSKLEKKLL